MLKSLIVALLGIVLIVAGTAATASWKSTSPENTSTDAAVPSPGEDPGHAQGENAGNPVASSPASEAAPAQAAEDGADCQSTVRLSDELVPSCGLLWGVAAGAKTSEQGPLAHRAFESRTGRTIGLYSHYYRADDLWPAPGEIALARESGARRILLINWRIASDMTWADVVLGRADGRIDAEINYLKGQYFHLRDKFFLTLHQEMEPEVIESPGSGMQAKDYAAMYRYVLDRFRASGIDNIVPVMAYLGSPQWANKPWFDDLWPGDEYVSWISWNPYAWSPYRSWSPKTFSDLVNYTRGRYGYPGFYDFITSRHPGVPLMLAEWGVFEEVADQASCYADYRAARKSSSTCRPLGSSDMARFFDSVRQAVDSIATDFPSLKAMVFFEVEVGSQGNTRFAGNSEIMREFDKPHALEAYRRLSGDPLLVNPPPLPPARWPPGLSRLCSPREC